VQEEDVIDQLDWQGFTYARPKGVEDSTGHEAFKSIALRRSNESGREADE
jgi:hypothetical protein